MALGASFILPPLTAITLAGAARVVHVLRPPPGRPDPEGKATGMGRRGGDPAARARARSPSPSPRAPQEATSSKATPPRFRAWTRTRTQPVASAPRSASASGAGSTNGTDGRSCLMILADGAKADTFESLLAAGDLPEISQHVVERGSYRTGTSVFTSTTGPAHIPLLSGCYPGTVDVPGYRWFDRDRYRGRGPAAPHALRSYNGPEVAYLAERHGRRAPHALRADAGCDRRLRPRQSRPRPRAEPQAPRQALRLVALALVPRLRARRPLGSGRAGRGGGDREPLSLRRLPRHRLELPLHRRRLPRGDRRLSPHRRARWAGRRGSSRSWARTTRR